MNLYRRLWWVAAVLLAVPAMVELVLVVSPLAAVTAAIAVGTTSSLVCAAVLAQRPGPTPTRAVVTAGIGGAVTGMVTTGLGALLGGRSAVLVLVVAGCHPLVLGAAAGWTRRCWRRGALASPATPPTGGPDAGTPVPITGPGVVGPRDTESAAPPTDLRWSEASALTLLSTPDLCWGWRTSFTALERASPQDDAAGYLALISVRQRYLDEIARRDHAGLLRWLQAGARPASDPSRYLRTDPHEPRSATQPVPSEAGHPNENDPGSTDARGGLG